MIDSAAAYASGLLRGLGREGVPDAPCDAPPHAWRRAGLFDITGRPDGFPLVCPAPLATVADGAMIALAHVAGGSGTGLPPCGAGLLGERARILGLGRQGAISANGTCAILECRDGHVAINRARTEDDALIAIALDCDCARDWSGISAAVAPLERQEVMERFVDLAVPVACARALPADKPFHIRDGGSARDTPRPLVVDFSSLWAGPLAGSLLAMLGAEVVKVESQQRPDGARFGSKRFYDLLNADKASLCFDFGAGDDRRLLRRLVAAADMVIEASRPRALAGLGLDRMAEVGRGCIWVSITAHDDTNRVGFGDDAAVEGGLAAAMEHGWGSPLFAGDAIADPIAGMHAALAAWSAWTQRQGQLVQISLSGTTSHAIGAGIACRDRLVEWQAMARRDGAPLYALRAAPRCARSIGTDNGRIGAYLDSY